MNAPLPATAIAATAALAAWSDVCAFDDVEPWTGICALVEDRQVAVVRTADEVFALDNRDPFSGAMVMSRGIVGDAKGIAKIASPVYKQSFALRTGQCLDDPSVRIATWSCRVRAGRIEVRA